MEKRLWKKRKIFDTTVRSAGSGRFGEYKTADVDRLIRRYVKEQADAAPFGNIF